MAATTFEHLADDSDNCNWCGTPLPDDSMWGVRRFCSSKCRNRWHYRNEPEMFHVPRHGERTCPSCGGTFPAYTARQKFCGLSCYWQNKRGKPEPEHLRRARARRC